MQHERPSTVHLGTQYYRAPFPFQKHWRDDLSRMRDNGLDTVQLWVLWSWVEASPGTMVWDDYDELVNTAGEVGLNVVLSTIAEMQPYWIFREVPDCHMINQYGQKVQSYNRGETHFGCTPGGCTDHPGVWERMSNFLTAVGERYVGVDHLVGWDAWNELRWNVESDGWVCYCPHTINKYHNWLEDQYGSLAGLNEAWHRRYASWEDVWPGRKVNLPYTDLIAWQHFITHRANEHGRKRYDILKAIDPNRPVTVHAGQPSPSHVGWGNFTAIDRGNDWDYADHMDGIGCSSFPKWGGMSDSDFAVRVENVTSAARGKRVWLSEVQGGRHANGFEVGEPVPARDQQRWIWNGFACGADTILFWCWRDEIFGRESAGFGIIGKDGLADERLAALKVTGEALKQHGSLLAGYVGDPASVGVMFSPQSYYLYFSQDGGAYRAGDALKVWCKALVEQTIPYQVLEEEHVDDEMLARLKLIILPRCVALPENLTARLSEWVKAGGTLVCESECGAYGPQGIYAAGEDRFLMTLAGLNDAGRRPLEEGTIKIELGDDAFDLGVSQWATPYLLPEGGKSFADHAEGSMLASVPVGQGRVIALGSYIDPHHAAGLSQLVKWCCEEAHVEPAMRVVNTSPDADAEIYLRTGVSGGKRLIYIFADHACKEVALDCKAELLSGQTLTDLRAGYQVEPVEINAGYRLTIPMPEIGFAVLAEL